MLPTKSNTADKGCSPVSSNCVVWQGPDLSCINLCKGDSISDVTYKVATQLCTIKAELDLTDLDLSCLLNFCAAVNPAPTEKTLSAVLEFIIDKICCLNGIVENIDLSSTYVEPTLTLPTCLQYTDQTTNQLITVLQHNQYTLRIANQFCVLKTTVDNHTSQISGLDSRVTALENEPDPTLPEVTPTCFLSPGTPSPITALVDEMENQLCGVIAALGPVSNITAAAAQQCANLGSSNALSTSGTMSQIAGWNTVAGTLSKSIQNLWITVCDMRDAIAYLQSISEVSACTKFVLNFTASTNNDRTQVLIDFTPAGLSQSFIPALYGNSVTTPCSVIITDGVTVTRVNNFDLVSALADADPTPVTLVANTNTSATYTVTVVGNIISEDGATSCSKSFSQTILVPCPVVSNVTATVV